MKYYISGPMTGIPEYNAPAFAAAAEKLRKEGHHVISPVEMDKGFGDTYDKERESGVWQCADKHAYLRRDLMMLMNHESTGIEAIYMLAGWFESEGAKLEHAVAKAFGLTITYETPLRLIEFTRKTASELAPPPPQAPVEVGVKHDEEKEPWHLLPYDALEQVVKVLKFGAGKYSPRNWEKGMAWHRCFRATINHMQEWWRGRKADPETGLTPLAHAACEVLFLLAYELRKAGEDDRP